MSYAFKADTGMLCPNETSSVVRHNILPPPSDFLGLAILVLARPSKPLPCRIHEAAPLKGTIGAVVDGQTFRLI